MKKEPLDWPEEAFDGNKISVQIVEKKCPHKDIKYKTANEIVCRKCGACWTGPASMIGQIYDILTK